MKWFDNAVVYHIYPLGYCNVPRENSFLPIKSSENAPILKIKEHIPTIKSLGFNAMYIGPLFESSKHGYDTADYSRVDSRLGTNADFAALSEKLHENGISVILDGVFNHVGRDFWAFKDVRQNGLNSRYKDWFNIRQGNSNYNDGFFYEGWEGHFDLVKLNLQNPEVKQHIFDMITAWHNEFKIDGLRLDVAYCLDLQFLKELRNHCKGLKDDFWLMGETLHGDYNKWLNPEMLDSVTNYECYKGLFSSFNELNMFEIAYSLNRQFGSENWCIYRGKKLYTFVDNHDVSRIASHLKKVEHLNGIYTLLFTMPGVPGVYYGSEYGLDGQKNDGDNALRPAFDIADYKPSALTETIGRLAKAHATLEPLYNGDYKQIALQNKHLVFARSAGGEIVYSLINADDAPVTVNLNSSGEYSDVLSGKIVDISKPVEMKPHETMVLFRAKV